MKKFALLLFIFTFSSVPVFAQLSEILKRIEQHQKALKSLSADLTIAKFSLQFGGTYTKECVIKFLPVNDYSLRIDSTKPSAESFLVIKNQYLLYQPDFKLAYTGIMTDSQKNTLVLFSFLLKDKLKANYNLKYLGEEKVNGAIPAWHLELTPKIATNYKTVELWVDGNGMPIQSKIIENNGDWTTVFLGNLQKNISIKVSDFKIDLPKATKLIKN